MRELQKNQITKAERDVLVEREDNRAVKNKEQHQLINSKLEALLTRVADTENEGKALMLRVGDVETQLAEVRDNQDNHHAQQVDKDRKWYERVDALHTQWADMEKRIPPPRLRDAHGRDVSRKKRKEMKAEQKRQVV